MVKKTTYFLFAAASSALAASLFLLYEVRRGVPLRFETELALAATLSFLLPLIAVAAARRLTPLQGPYAGFAAYIVTAGIVAILFGLALLF